MVPKRENKYLEEKSSDFNNELFKIERYKNYTSSNLISVV